MSPSTSPEEAMLTDTELGQKRGHMWGKSLYEAIP